MPLLVAQDYGSGNPMVLIAVPSVATGGPAQLLFMTQSSVDQSVNTEYMTLTGMHFSERTEADADGIIPTDGVLSDYDFRASADIGAAGDDVTVTLRLNGSDTGMSCTLEGETSGSQTVPSCSGGPITVSVGDLVNYVAVVAGASTPDAGVQLQHSIVFTSDTPNETIYMSRSSSTLEEFTQWWAFNTIESGRNSSQLDQAYCQMPFQTDSTITKLYVQVLTACGSGDSAVFKMDENGSDANEISCTIANAATECDSEAQTATVSQGDKYAFKRTPTAGCDVGSSLFRISVVIVNTDDEFAGWSHSRESVSPTDTDHTTFNHHLTQAWPAASESTEQMAWSPGFTLTSMVAFVADDYTGTQARDLCIRDDGADAMCCIIDVGISETDQTCITNGSATVVADSLLNYESDPINSPASGIARIGWAATNP